jgi:hypothetical protein
MFQLQFGAAADRRFHKLAVEHVSTRRLALRHTAGRWPARSEQTRKLCTSCFAPLNSRFDGAWRMNRHDIASTEHQFMIDTVKLDRVLKIGSGFWASKTLLSAVEVGDFTEPADLAALSRLLGLHERSARDFLDALVALKLLERRAGIYRNTAAPLGLGITDAGTFHLYRSVSERAAESDDTLGAVLCADPDRLRFPWRDRG